MKIQAFAAGVFVASVTLAYGVGWVNGHAVSSTAPARAGTSSSSPARSSSAGEGRIGDMANGSPAALPSDDGGGDRSGANGERGSGLFVPQQAAGSTPAPASTTVVSAVLSVESVAPPTVEATAPPKVSATVIISAQPPPATAVTSPRAVETLAPVSNTLEAQVRASHWPASLYSAVLCIVQRESGGNPGVTGALAERGLMQIHPTNAAYLEARGLSWARMYEPIMNLNAGYELYLYAGSFAPWGGGC